MGIQERKLRHQQQVRQSILNAATNLAANGGWAEVTIRKIADKIEYSLPIIYRHFSSKDDILAAIAQEGFQELFQKMTQSKSQSEDLKEKLRTFACNYVEFALEKPHIYQVMFDLEGVIFHNQETLKSSQIMFDFVWNLLNDLVENQRAKIENTHDMTEILWSTFHGLASLILVDRIRNGSERFQDMVRQSVDTYFAAWGITQN